MSEESDPETPAPSRFLDLPGELKNRIYRLVLVRPEGEVVDVNSTGYDRGGGLLGTCKEIRSEALKIFYYENEFSGKVHYFDISFMVKWSITLQRLRLSPKKAKLAGPIGQQPCWKNLLHWTKCYHQGVVHAKAVSPEQLQKRGEKGLMWHLLAVMFETVRTLHKQPWKLVEKVILRMRPSFTAEDPKWAED